MPLLGEYKRGGGTPPLRVNNIFRRGEVPSPKNKRGIGKMGEHIPSTRDGVNIKGAGKPRPYG